MSKKYKEKKVIQEALNEINSFELDKITDVFIVEKIENIIKNEEINVDFKKLEDSNYKIILKINSTKGEKTIEIFEKPNIDKEKEEQEKINNAIKEDYEYWKNQEDEYENAWIEYVKNQEEQEKINNAVKEDYEYWKNQEDEYDNQWIEYVKEKEEQEKINNAVKEDYEYWKNQEEQEKIEEAVKDYYDEIINIQEEYNNAWIKYVKDQEEKEEIEQAIKDYYDEIINIQEKYDNAWIEYVKEKEEQEKINNAVKEDYEYWKEQEDEYDNQWIEYVKNQEEQEKINNAVKEDYEYWKNQEDEYENQWIEYVKEKEEQEKINNAIKEDYEYWKNQEDEYDNQWIKYVENQEEKEIILIKALEIEEINYENIKKVLSEKINNDDIEIEVIKGEENRYKIKLSLDGINKEKEIEINQKLSEKELEEIRYRIDNNLKIVEKNINNMSKIYKKPKKINDKRIVESENSLNSINKDLEKLSKFENIKDYENKYSDLYSEIFNIKSSIITKEFNNKLGDAKTKVKKVEKELEKGFLITPITSLDDKRIIAAEDAIVSLENIYEHLLDEELKLRSIDTIENLKNQLRESKFYIGNKTLIKSVEELENNIKKSKEKISIDNDSLISVNEDIKKLKIEYFKEKDIEQKKILEMGIDNLDNRIDKLYKLIEEKNVEIENNYYNELLNKIKLLNKKIDIGVKITKTIRDIDDNSIIKAEKHIAEIKDFINSLDRSTESKKVLNEEVNIEEEKLEDLKYKVEFDKYERYLNNAREACNELREYEVENLKDEKLKNAEQTVIIAKNILKKLPENKQKDEVLLEISEMENLIIEKKSKFISADKEKKHLNAGINFIEEAENTSLKLIKFNPLKKNKLKTLIKNSEEERDEALEILDNMKEGNEKTMLINDYNNLSSRIYKMKDKLKQI